MTADEIRARVRVSFTGNTELDLRPYRATVTEALDALAVAEDEHGREASRRYEAEQAKRKAQGRER